MNRVVACVAVALLMASVAFSQSLGDVARQNRKAKQLNKKAAAHVYTNDDIPSVAVMRDAPQSPAATGDAAGVVQEKKADAPLTAEGTNKATESSAGPKKSDEARAKAEEQRKTVELLERELNVAQREQQIQTVVFYTDAGSRLRDPKDWTEKQKRYQDEIAAKNKSLVEAKQKLQDLEEEARHSETSPTP